MKRLLLFIFFSLILFCPTQSWAIDHEIQVCDSEINSLASGLSQPTYAGKSPYNHLLHITSWELNLGTGKGLTFKTVIGFKL
jgi:hypothetical protein